MEDKVCTMRGSSFPKDKFITAMEKYVLAEDVTEVDIVTAAGGEGIFNFKWGTHKSLTKDTVEVLNKFGFTEVTEEINE